MTPPTVGLTCLLLLTVLSSALNVALFFKALKLSTLSRELGMPQAHNFKYSYNPTEVPGQFSPAAMAIEAPDSAYPIGDNLKWASILPEKRGFIRLGPAGTPFSIALYHQLHCVNGIRYVYVAARDGLFKTPEDRSASIGHANHCFDVLRQSLLCKADTTLMPVGRSNATTIVRRSRNWSQVREFVRSNQGFWKGIPYSTEPHAKATDKWDE